MNKALHRRIGDAIAEARMIVGMTQGVLADRIGLGRTSVVNIENGRQRISVETLVRIAEVLRVEPFTLLRRATTQEVRP